MREGSSSWRGKTHGSTYIMPDLVALLLHVLCMHACSNRATRQTWNPSSNKTAPSCLSVHEVLAICCESEGTPRSLERTRGKQMCTYKLIEFPFLARYCFNAEPRIFQNWVYPVLKGVNGFLSICHAGRKRMKPKTTQTKSGEKSGALVGIYQHENKWCVTITTYTVDNNGQIYIELKARKYQLVHSSIYNFWNSLHAMTVPLFFKQSITGLIIYGNSKNLVLNVIGYGTFKTNK